MSCVVGEWHLRLLGCCPGQLVTLPESRDLLFVLRAEDVRPAPVSVSCDARLARRLDVGLTPNHNVILVWLVRQLSWS